MFLLILCSSVSTDGMDERGSLQPAAYEHNEGLLTILLGAPVTGPEQSCRQVIFTY